MTTREKLTEKVNEMKDKYADVINDLAVKYDYDLGVAFWQLIVIARAKFLGQEPMYNADIEYNIDELITDYIEYLDLAKMI